MEKAYMVVVNNKYLVKVMATSDGGAEHKILDNVRYTTTALAFDPITESKNYGWAYGETIRAISFEELCNLSNRRLADAYEQMNNTLSEHSAIERHIKDLERQIAESQEYLLELRSDMDNLHNDYGAAPRYTSAEEIRKLQESEATNRTVK